ncbi:hypothetical protein REPUB_Repub04eG0254600 [Reevesia pubescens]
MSGRNIPRCLGGDFNVVRFVEEKLGTGFNLGAMSHFNEFNGNQNMIDLPMEGG